jgi:glycosyltransferase involved in cell wall biosynthesis
MRNTRNLKNLRITNFLDSILLNMHAKPTLAFFIPSMSDGGAERVTLNLVNNIAKRHDVNVHLVLAKAVGPFLRLVESNVKIIDLESKNTRNSVFALARYLSEYKPAAVVSALHHANIIALIANKLCRGFSSRIIVTLHINLSVSVKNPTNFRARFIRPIVKITYRWADRIVGVSTGVSNDFADSLGISRDQVDVIFNPVITPDVKVKSLEDPQHRWFSDRSVPVVLAAGRLSKQKNFAMLVDAFNLIKDDTPANLLILGEGDSRESLQSKINNYGLQSRVELAGFVDNPYAYMTKSKVFVMSSLFEGLPTVLIEALYCGTSLVSTDCPSGPREILRDGELGVLVPLGDVNQLGAAMLAALSTKRPSTLDTAWLPYEADTVADQYMDVMLPN